MCKFVHKHAGKCFFRLQNTSLDDYSILCRIPCAMSYKAKFIHTNSLGNFNAWYISPVFLINEFSNWCYKVKSFFFITS